MNQIKIYIVFMLLVLGQIATAQQHNFSLNIQWQPMHELQSNDEVIKRMYFNEANYIDDHQLPLFTYNIPVNNQQGAAEYKVTLSNMVFENCSDDEVALLKQHNIIGSQQINIDTYIAIEKKQRYLEITFYPFIFENNQFRKLLSADLNIESMPLPKQQSAKRSLGNETQTMHQYANSSVLANGDWYKIRISDTGIHRLTYEDLIAIGIKNPALVRVFGYGGAILNEDFSLPRKADDLPELAIFMEKGSDGVFNHGDYILFHAQGTIRWDYDDVSGFFEHSQNYYSKYGYYFLTEGQLEGKRIESQALITDAPAATIKDFLNFGLYEKELINFLESGREWYGDKLTPNNNTLTVPFSFPGIVSNKQARVEISIAGNSTQSSSFTVDIDNSVQTNKITIFAITSYFQAARKGNGTYFVMPKAADGIDVKLTYQAQNSSAFAHLDYIRINAYQSLRMNGNAFYFRMTDQDLRYEVLRYELENATSDTKIWDITDPLNIIEIPTNFQNGILSFVSAPETNALVREFVAIKTNSAFAKPHLVGKVPNQNLHAIQQVDYVIIAPVEFHEQANRLASFHQQKGLSVLVVQPELIYNEFSSGTPDATAYRWLMKMLYDRAGSDVSKLPKALLFMGVSSYDNRGLVHQALPLLSYQSVNSLVATSSYTTDDYYAFLDDNEGVNIARDRMDIGVGRLPVANITEARVVVDKIIAYANNTKKGPWKNYAVFLGDDGDGNIHMSQSDNLVQIFQQYSKAYQPIKVYLDAYQIVQTASGSSYPTAKERMLNILKSGVLIFNFVGHGSVNSLTEEQTIVRRDIEQMTNENLALWVTATCDFSRYDNNATSSGMRVLLNPHGGGIALLTTTRTVFSGENFRLSQQIYQHILPSNPLQPITLGEIMRRGKIGMGTDSNKLNFALLGDPMLSLTYPTQRVITTKINEVEQPEKPTINALSLVTVEGYVENALQTGVDESFNGTVYVVVFDKEENLQTLSNRGNQAFTYKDRPNILFSGKTSVENGVFSIVYMVPKDINYRYGEGRMVYYAVDNTRKVEANGYNESFIVGGSNNDIIPTDNGPIVRMYLNTPHFVSGQTVNKNPVFYAFMNDDYGINTVGAGIGHDIVLKLNNKPEYTFVLNDFYQASLNDYKSGYIRYPLTNLPNGKYELQFKVWNLQNVSTTQTLHFTVADDAAPQIYSFSVFPNPAKISTQLILEHNRPDELVSATFRLYDIAGRLFWQSNVVSTFGDEKVTYTWDLSDGSGTKIRAGNYIMNVVFETQNGTFTSANQKIIVLSQ